MMKSPSNKDLNSFMMFNANESHRKTFQSALGDSDVIMEALNSLISKQAQCKSGEIVGIVKLVIAQILILKSPIYSK
jgi:hypothetical protein